MPTPEGSFIEGGKTNAAIETASGVYIDLAKPMSGDLRLSDIAHHLAQANRYAGACVRPYSVAEHAVLVSLKLEAEGESWTTCLLGLHHDDAEFALHDVTRPLKVIVGPLYRPAENRMMAAISVALNLPLCTIAQEKAIKNADNWALSKEAYYLMPSKGKGWWCEGIYDPFKIEPGYLNIPAFMDWDIVRQNYLHRHEYVAYKINEESK